VSSSETSAALQARPLADQAAASPRHPLSLVLLTLTFSTGLVDAVSYLGLGHVFTANMTGNIVLLGFGIAGSGGLPVLAPIVSLVSFLVGAGAGGTLGKHLADRQQHARGGCAWDRSVTARRRGRRGRSGERPAR
jgi:Protein of unknown function (DUF1275)